MLWRALNASVSLVFPLLARELQSVWDSLIPSVSQEDGPCGNEERLMECGDGGKLEDLIGGPSLSLHRLPL